MSTPTPFLFPGMPSIDFPSQTGTSVYSVALCKIIYFLWMALGPRQVLLHQYQEHRHVIGALSGKTVKG